MIDDFKAHKDLHGHPAGDECLRRIGAVLIGFGRRAGDPSARIGGEEFALILASTNRDAATRIARQLLEAIRDLRIPHEVSTTGPTVTASLGVAALVPAQAGSETRLVGLADEVSTAPSGAGKTASRWPGQNDDGLRDAHRSFTPRGATQRPL